MATVKVKVLKNHVNNRPRLVGAVYLLDSGKVPFMVKQGYVKRMPKKKKENEATNTD